MSFLSGIGSAIGSITGGFKLPDLGTIGKDILAEGKNLLGQVAKDEFQLSDQPGKVLSEDLNLNILGDNIRLPNPLNSLANKLLGKADDALGNFGVNVDFKKLLGNVFHLPTESGGTVAVPPVKQRAVMAGGLGGGGVDAVGGGATTSTTSSSGGITGGSNSYLTGATSTTSDPFNGAISNLAGGIGDMNKQINDVINNKNMDPSEKQAKLMELQQQEQALNECLSLLSNIMKDEHDTRMTAVNNIRG